MKFLLNYFCLLPIMTMWTYIFLILDYLFVKYSIENDMCIVNIDYLNKYYQYILNSDEKKIFLYNYYCLDYSGFNFYILEHIHRKDKFN